MPGRERERDRERERESGPYSLTSLAHNMWGRTRAGGFVPPYPCERKKKRESERASEPASERERDIQFQTCTLDNARTDFSLIA